MCGCSARAFRLSTPATILGAVNFVTTILTLRAQSSAASGADAIAAEVAGLHLAFLVAAGIGVIAVALALTLRKTEAEASGHGPRPESTDDQIAVADADLR